MKKYIFLALSGLLTVLLCGTVVAAEMPDNNYVNLEVSNDQGARIDTFGNETYNYFCGEGTGGLNSLKINNETGSTAAKVTTTTEQSGTFYIVTTGGQGRVDDGILMLAVNGTLPDNFQVRINASGYTWTPASGFTPTQGDLTYNPVTLDETFYKSDFLYDSQIWRPYYQPNYPIFEKQDMTDTGNTFHIMLIDLYSGILVGSNYASLIDNGAIKIQYTFQNLPIGTLAAFNAYGYSATPESGQVNGSVQWTNKLNKATETATGVSGYFVTGTTPPVVPPVAEFNANPVTGTAPLNVQFTDTSTGTINSYAWDFNNDGTTDSTQQNPSWTYNTPGTYTVKLTVTGPGGNDEEIKTNLITVNQAAPVASFSANPTNGNTPLNVQFTDTSTGTINSYAWDFNNDGTTDSTQQNPSWTYNTPGTYTVKLTVTGPGGNDEEVKTDYITVNPDITPPTVNANPTGGNYDTAQNVVLTANEPATIYYTTNGSDPTTSSTQYSGPINIGTTTTLKFMAVDNAGNQGNIQTETYNIKSDVYVQITPSITNPQVGDKVTYTFKLGNNGPGDASNIVFTYVVPEGLEYAGANVDQGTVNYDETTRTITWMVGDVAANVDPYLWLDLNIQAIGTYNILPTVTVDGYNPGLINNIGSLLVNASVKTNTVSAATTTSMQTTSSVQAGSVPMQSTGIPLAGLVLGVLSIGSGLTLSRKK